MKQLVLIIGLVGVMVACHYENPGYYKGDSYIQMYYPQDPGVDSARTSSPSRQSNYTTVVSSTVQYDTAWFQVQAFGLLSSENRKVMLEQYVVEPEEGYATPVAGVNYVPFDDPGLADYMVMPSDTCVTEIPVVVKYDPNTPAGQQFKLYVKLIPTEDFDVTIIDVIKGCLTFTNN